MLMLLFNLRSQYWQQRKTGSAIKAVINTPCCGNTCKGGEKKSKKKSWGCLQSATSRSNQGENIKLSTIHSPSVQIFMRYHLCSLSYIRLWDLNNPCFHKQMSCKEAKQSELYEKAHLVNCSQHTQGKSSQQFLTEEENGLLPSKIISVFSTQHFFR